jgi:hypothetical protein
MSAYAHDQASRIIEMKTLGDDLRRIRACCIVDRLNKQHGITMTPEAYTRAVNYYHQLLRTWTPEIEATYKQNGSRFSNIFAETILNYYLATAQQAKP